ncbi:MAG: flagellar filament capping protein FliD [Planctomycetota bacterium]
MSSFGIQFSGLASGIDTRSLIDAIVGARRVPIQRLQGQRQDLVDRQNSISRLSGLLADLRSAASNIGFGDSAISLGATIQDGAGYSINLGDNAAPGSFDIQVQKLASSQSNSSLGYADPSAVIGSGSITLTQNGVPTTLNFTNATLQDVADAIGGLDGFDATVVDTGDTTAPFRLLLFAEEPGSANAVDLSSSGDAGFATLVSDLKSNELTEASDSNILVNNVEIRRSTNSISDLIDGVTIELESVTEQAHRVDVALDTDATSETVEEFLQAYNAVVDAIRSESQRSEDGRTGNLFGDRTALTVLRGLRDLTGRTLPTNSGVTGLLSSFGIEGSLDGTLSLDRGELSDALRDGAQDFDDLLASGGGLIDRLQTLIDDWRAADGLIESRDDGLDQGIRSLDNRIERGEARLALLEQSLSARFTSLETLLARVQSQGQALGGLSNPGSAFGL